MATKFFLLVFGIVTISLVTSGIKQERASQFKITTHHAVYLADIKGFMQTPIGGTPGTSDFKRPTFAELGIENVLMSDELISLHWKDLIIYAGYQHVNPKGNGRLTKALRTYGQLIPANTVIETSNRFDWYRLGVAFPITITDNLKFTPKLEIAVLDFDYHFCTNKLNKHRGYHHLTLRMGKSLVYKFTPQWAFQFQSFASLPFFRVLNMKDSLLDIRYKQSQISYSKQKIDFEDGQALPNHLSLDTTVLITPPTISSKEKQR